MPTAQKPTAVLDALAAIAEKGDAVESLARDAYEISFSSRRVGAEKVRGGYTPDATGERASCECGGEHPVTGELIGGRDAETGRIIHICSPYRYKRAGGNVVQAMRALTDAVRRPSRRLSPMEVIAARPHMTHHKKASEWRPKFLSALRNSGNVRAASLAAGIGRKTAYRHRERSKNFAADWDEAIEDACDAMEAEAFRRAMQGVEKPITVAGEREVIRDYSDTLLIFMLKAHRPHKFRERVEHTGDGGDPITLHVVYDDD